ncbi:hypothetical protein RRG08_006824 [Elysia crispata]|uniref:Uncharacterized protein n=1 Tax=Elysia crispata TaxID=231223 RepID=A0AAE0XVJ5_9GAST|nr:hypothetical protein RRG08_006824 [Elysia crispata]
MTRIDERSLYLLNHLAIGVKSERGACNHPASPDVLCMYTHETEGAAQGIDRSEITAICSTLFYILWDAKKLSRDRAELTM